MSAASASSTCAAIRSSLARSLRAASRHAPPEITSERLANVPQPYGVRSVSPWMTRTRSGVTPTASAMICARVVRNPWPCGLAPMRASTQPDGSIATCTVSHPGVISMPRAAKAGEP